jgi:hypothetical protein
LFLKLLTVPDAIGVYRQCYARSRAFSFAFVWHDVTIPKNRLDSSTSQGNAREVKEITMDEQLTAGQKAARTRKRRQAGKKAALTKKRREAGRKAALTKKRREAGRKAAETRRKSS